MQGRQDVGDTEGAEAYALLEVKAREIARRMTDTIQRLLDDAASDGVVVVPRADE